jgi:hypothetical protein
VGVSNCAIQKLPAVTQTYVVGRLRNVAEGGGRENRGDLLRNVDVGHDGDVWWKRSGRGWVVVQMKVLIIKRHEWAPGAAREVNQLHGPAVGSNPNKLHGDPTCPGPVSTHLLTDSTLGLLRNGIDDLPPGRDTHPQSLSLQTVQLCILHSALLPSALCISPYIPLGLLCHEPTTPIRTYSPRHFHTARCDSLVA